MEEAVVDHVGEPVLVVRDQRLEAVAPEYLAGQVRAARLRRLPCALRRSLEQHHDLEPLVDDVLRTQVVQRAVGINLVHHHLRPDQQYVRVVVVHIELSTAECQHLKPVAVEKLYVLLN